MSSTTELQAWLNGTINGGPQGDGRYPMTYKDGQVHMILCPAAQTLDPSVYYAGTALAWSGLAPDGQIGVAYNHSYNISGGTAPYTRITNTLPAGLSAAISGSFLSITGSPTAVVNGQSINVTVKDSAATQATVTVVDAINVVAAASTAPGAPVIGSATAGNTQATVSFSAPASNGGSPITSYTTTASPGGLTATGANSPLTVTGLTNGTAYTFTVKATNAVGLSPASAASNSVTPVAGATVSSAPIIGSATAQGTQATVTFTAPTSNGGSTITSYTATSSPGGFTATGAGSPLTVVGLANSTAYTFTVKATNGIGLSPPSAASNSVTTAAASSFNPATLYAAGQKGLWTKASDLSTGFQDSAGATTQTAAGQPTGKRLDKSGRGNHVIQATAPARPIFDLVGGIYADKMDGFDDGYGTVDFAAGTLTSNMDCFMLIRRSNNLAVPISGTRGANFYFDMRNGAGVPIIPAGAVTTFAVNGVAVAGGTSANSSELNNMVTTDQWFVLEIRNHDFSEWVRFLISQYYSGYYMAGSVAETILCPAQDAATRTQIRQYLAAQAGITLP